MARALWWLALLSVLISSTHLRFGSLDWSIEDIKTSDETKRYIKIHFFQAIRGSLEPDFCKGCEFDPEGQVCNPLSLSTCWRLAKWNGYIYFDDTTRHTDRFTYHSFGQTAAFTSASEERTFSDGSTLSTGLQNWWMTERVLYHQYEDFTEKTISYSTCCRQYSGVRNVVNGEDLILKATVNLKNVLDNSITQNPHCSAFPIYFWPFKAGEKIEARISLRNLCSTPFDSDITFTWTGRTDSGLLTNGDVAWTGGLTRPTLEESTGLMKWAPDEDGLHALQFTVTDKWGNTNSLDIIFDVSESGDFNPYFVEIRDNINGAEPTTTTDIYSPAAREVLIGQSITIGLWAYAPSGEMSQILYSWSRNQQSTIVSNCDGISKYCELQFQYTPELGQGDADLCAQAVSTAGTYVGAPSDPSFEVTFCIPISVRETDYIYLSGFVRDFRPEDMGITAIPYDTSGVDVEEPNFIEGALSSTLRPIFDSSVALSTLNESNYQYWFEDSEYSERLTLSIVLALISGDAGEPGSVYECIFDPWYPINCAGYDTDCSDDEPNKYFTYDVITYFEYKSGTKIQFTVTDYLWVFIDGKLVLVNTKMTANPETKEIDLDALVWLNPPVGTTQTEITLEEGTPYSLSLLYVHRSDYEPFLNWQVPGGSICDAVSGANVTFVVDTLSADSIKDTQNGAGMVAIEGNRLRIASTQTLSSSALWYAENGVAQRFYIRDGFQTEFSFQIGSEDEATGDGVPGFAFVLQADSDGARGGASAGLGYEGITNAAVIEFDGIQDSSKGDPLYKHASFHISSGLGAAVTSQEVSIPDEYFTEDPIELTYGTNASVRITYLPGQDTSGSATKLGWIYLFLNGEPRPILQVSVESSQFDIFAENAFVGFTAGTSSDVAVPIYISDWSFKVVTPSATLTYFESKQIAGTAGDTVTGIVVQARDSCANDVTTGGDGGNFGVTLFGEDGSNLTVSILDLGSGRYSMQFTPIKAQSYTMTVLYQDQPINGGDNEVTNIQITPGAVDLTESTLSELTTPITAGDPTSGTFILRDSYGNVIKTDLQSGSDAPVTVSISPDPTSFTPEGSLSVSFETSSSTYTINWQTFKSSIYTIRVTYDNQDVLGGTRSPQEVEVKAGPVDLSQCELGEISSETVVSGESESFKVIVADEFANQIVDDPSPFSVNYTVDGPSNDPGCTSCNTCVFLDGDAFLCNFTRFIVGDHLIIPDLYNGNSLIGKIPNGNFSVSISVGADSAKSIALSSRAETIVGRSRTFFIQARDAYNNTRTSPNSAGEFSVVADPELNIDTPSYTTTGQYSFSYVTTNSTFYGNITLSVYWTPVGGGTPELIVGGVVTDSWKSESAFSIEVPATIVGNVGTSDNVFVANVLDVYTNPTDDDQLSNLQVRVLLPDNGISTADIAYISSNNYTIAWQTTQKGMHTIQFFVNDVLKDFREVDVPAGPTAGGIVTTSDPGWSEDQKRDAATFVTITAVDAFNNIVGSDDDGLSNFTLQVIPGTDCTADLQIINSMGVDGSYNKSFIVTCEELSQYNLKAFFEDDQLASTSRNVLEGAAVPGNSIVLDYPEVFSSVVSDVTLNFTIFAKNKDNNSRTAAADNQGFTFVITPIILPYTSVNPLPDSPSLEVTDGSALITAYGLTLQYAGNYTMRIFDGLELQQSIDLNGYVINVQPGAVARFLAGTTNLASTVSRNGSTLTGILTTAGTSEVLFLTLNDRYGQPFQNTSAVVKAFITYANSSTLTVLGVYTSDNIWRIILPGIALVSTGTHSFVLTANEEIIGQSTYQLTITPAAFDPTESSFSITGSTTRTTAGSGLKVRVIIRDRFGNNAEVPSSLVFTANSTNNATGSSTLTTISENLLTFPSDCIENSVQYCFEFTQTSTIVGDYLLKLSHNDGDFPGSDNYLIKNSLTVSTTLTTVVGLSNIDAGDVETFLVDVFDEYGNIFQFTSAVELNSFKVVATSPSGSRYNLVQDNGATYNLDGQWSLELTGCAVGNLGCIASCQTCVSGSYTFSIFYRSSNIYQSGPALSITASPLKPSNRRLDYIYAGSQADATSVTVGDFKTGISVQTYDFFLNEVDSASSVSITGSFFDGETPICNEVTGDETAIPVTFMTVSSAYQSDGIYALTYRSTKIGTYFLAMYVDGELVCETFTQATVNVAPFDPAKTEVTDFSDIPASGSGEMLLSFIDPYDNSVSAPKDTNVKITGLNEFNISTGGESWVLDGTTWTVNMSTAAPTFSLNYTTTLAQNYAFSVFVDGVPVSYYRKSDETSVAEIAAAFGEIANFRMVSPSTTVELTLTEFTITPLDSFGNTVLRDDFSVSVNFQRISVGVDYQVLADEIGTSSGLSNLVTRFQLTGTFVPTVILYDSKGSVIVESTQVISNEIEVIPLACSARNATKPYKCIDGTCVQKYEDCADSSSYCPQDLPIQCSTNTSLCVAAASECPCPASYTRCATGGCRPAGECLFQQICEETQILCNGTKVCRDTVEDCPSPIVCSPGYLMCPDGITCALHAENCTELTRGDSCPDASLKRCPDGACARTINDCATPITCPLPDQVICFSDGGCYNSSYECPQITECSEVSLVNAVKCADGSCKSSSEDCASQIVCPISYVQCLDGSCVQSLSDCTSANIIDQNPSLPGSQACSASQVLCQDGSCASNIALCPSSPTCPAKTPVHCSDGSCRATISQCSEPTQCSSGEKRCGTGACVPVNYDCPTARACGLEENPVLCPIGDCVSHSNNCTSTPDCPVRQVRCSDGTCMDVIEDCPSYPTCPDTQPVLCPDGACRAAPDQCVDATLTICPEGLRKCASGQCVSDLLLCATVISCYPYKRCLDGTCRDSCPLFTGEDSSPCGRDEIQCPQVGLGISCRQNIADCPAGVVCPPQTPVKCMDATCAESVQDCPLPPTTWTTKIPCPDGSFESQFDSCGTATTCTPASPYMCWDQTCRVSPLDCPPNPKCSGSTPFLCSDGTCKSALWNCRATSSCPKTTPVRCPNSQQDCQATVDTCEDIIVEEEILPSGDDSSICPTGFERCRDGFCAKAAQCEAFSCSSELPFECEQGTCALTFSQCPLANGCQYNTPYKCSTGQCVQTEADCPVTNITCEAGYTGAASSVICNADVCIQNADVNVLTRRPCADGSCQAIYDTQSGLIDYSSCPGFSSSDEEFEKGDPSGCPVGRCHDGTCVSQIGDCTKSFGDENYCPASTPFLCDGGFCATSSTACPDPLDSSDCPDGGVRCHSGECYQSYSQCPLIKSCTSFESVRCLDGTCKAQAINCPLYNSCPSFKPYRCPNGVCAISSSDCKVANGCPGNNPILCTTSGSNGQCVSSAELCSNATDSSDGCPSLTTKCWNGECTESIYQCPQLNGCGYDVPYRCNNGTCVSNPNVCTQENCESPSHLCADGSCVNDLSTCGTSYLCPVSKPIRCVTGECRAYSAHQRVLTGETDSCYAKVICPNSQVLCADGSCKESLSLCSPTSPCTDPAAAVLCPDFTCAAKFADCNLEPTFCPPKNPLLCPSGSCVSNPKYCTPFLAPQDQGLLNPLEYQCFDGSFTDDINYCVVLANSILLGVPIAASNEMAQTKLMEFTKEQDLQESNTDSTRNSIGERVSLQVVGTDPSSSCTEADHYMCPNGLCVPKSEKAFSCDAVSACQGSTPHRCGTGLCVATSSECEEFTCESGNVCADGTCRSACPEYDGCPPFTYLCPYSLECKSNLNECQDNRASWLDRYLSTAGVKEIGLCLENCYRNLKPESLFVAIFSNFDTQITAIDDATLGQALTLNVPAGALNLTNDDPATLIIGPASDSEMRDTFNFVRRGWQSLLGDYLTFPHTLLSPAFKCFRSPNIESFQLNITVTAYIDRTYPHSPQDICLGSANIVSGEWRCVQPLFADRLISPIELSGNTVSSSMGFCDVFDSEGTIYAFIYAPGSDRPLESVEDDRTFWEKNWIFLALLCIGALTMCSCLVYYCQRQLRYRDKYKIEDQKLREKKMELERMQNVGANAGNVGGEEIIMENSPLQMRIDNLNEMMSSIIDPEKLQEMCSAQDKAIKQRKGYISELEVENKRLEDALRGLQQEIRMSENESLLDDTVI